MVTKTIYHVDPQFLQGGETVLWASYDVEQKTPKKPGKTYKYVKILGVFAALCFAVFNAYTSSKMSVSFIENLSSPRVLPVVTAIGIGILLFIASHFFGFVDKKYGLEEKVTKLASELPQNYSAAMITDQRLVLYGQDLAEDYDLRAGDIKAARYDYSRGGRVIKLELVSGMDVRTVNLASTRDLAIAKQFIEDRFIRGGKMFRAQEALA